MANKVTYGLEKVHIAFVDTENATQPAWKVPVAVPGAVRATLTPAGQETKFPADNGTYFSATSNDGYTGELEMALVPDAVLAEMLGWKIDNNGMLVEISDGIQKEFALMFEVKGDTKDRRTILYRCKAARPAKEHTTKGETIEPKTDILILTAVPIEIDNKKVIKSTMELSATNTAAYDAFFTAVTKPNFTA